MKIAVLGLGNAGSLLATDLVAAGVDVFAFDPGDVPTPDGVERSPTAEAAAANADLVMAATAPLVAPAALAQVTKVMKKGAVYADISTGSPKMKRGLALTAERNGILFAGVAMLSVMAGMGLGAPSLVSGSGAKQYVELMEPLGAEVENVGEEPGTAASRKVLRGILIRGVAALGVEALEAGYGADDMEWLWANLNEELAGADEHWLGTMVTNFGRFAVHRRGEMESTPLHLENLGVDPIMTRATVEMVRRVQRTGIPEVPK